MKSVQMSSYGHANVLSYAEQAIPEPKSRDVLVKVHAVAVNPFDIKLMEGMYKENIPQKFPLTIGGDFAGEVIGTGERVRTLSSGMKVFGSALAFTGASGALAEYVTVNEEKVAPMPPFLKYDTAASFITPGCAAQQAVNWNMNVKPGEKVLIHGGAGAVGAIAIQICHNIGAQVAVTVSNDDIPYMKELGVDLIINYHLQPFENVVHEFDAVLDTQGGEVLARSCQVLKPGGIVVSLVSVPDPELLSRYKIRGMFQNTVISTDTLKTLGFLIEENIIRPYDIIKVPFDQCIEAIDSKIRGNIPGKIVIKLS